MQAPLLVRPLTDAERGALAAGLRSSQAFALRRAQIVLASARGAHVPAIARALGCDEQTVRNAIRALTDRGAAALSPGSSRPQTVHAAFDAAGAERLQDLLHRSPRDFGHPTSPWTLELAAQTAYTEGLTPPRVTGETVRATPARHKVRWKRAKRWITSPDPAYPRKKAPATACSAWRGATRGGPSAPPTRSGGAGWPTPPSAPGRRPGSRCVWWSRRSRRMSPRPWPATACWCGGGAMPPTSRPRHSGCVSSTVAHSAA
jgi:transposase